MSIIYGNNSRKGVLVSRGGGMIKRVKLQQSASLWASVRRLDKAGHHNHINSQ